MGEIKPSKISVVIPVYNTEKYVFRTLESVRTQTYKNIQIIIVNDCSPDGSDDIIKQYILNHLNLDIDYISLEENLGSAGARQVAIGYVKGKYLHFLDSDDYILPDTYTMAVTCMQKNDADICFWGRTDVSEDSEVMANYTDEFHYFDGVKSGFEVCKLKLQQWLWICTGNALYSFNIWKQLDPLFFSGLNMGEDLYSICKILLYADRVCCVENENFICTNRRVSMRHSWNPSQKCEVFKLLQKLSNEIDNMLHLSYIQRAEIKEALDWMTIESQLYILDSANEYFRNSAIRKTISVVKNLNFKMSNIPKNNIKLYLKRNRRIRYYIYKISPFLFVIMIKFIYKCKNYYCSLIKR